MNPKNILIVLIIFFIIFQTAGAVFAGANINVAFDRNTANVGDQVNLIITITNTGPDDLSGVLVSAPIPDGLKFVMSATGTTRNIYSPETGVWDVNNLKLTSQFGGVKTLTITTEVTPELAGKTVIATANYISVYSGDPPVALPLSSASGTLTINNPNPGNNTNGNSTGNQNSGNNTNNNSTSNTSNPPGNNTNGTTNRNDNITSLNDASALIGNIDDIGIQDIGKQEQNGPNGYEINNETANENKKDDPSTMWGLIIIAGVIILGYLIGSRNN